MIEQIDNMPGWTEGAGYFERCYATGAEDFPRARVRITPRQVDPGIAGAMNVPAAPIAVMVGLSIGLVGDDGKALTAAGRALVSERGSLSHQQETAEPFDPEAWLHQALEAEMPLVIAWARGLVAAAKLGLISQPAPAPEA